MSTIPITVAPGDGIGPEIMTAVLRVLQAVRAPLAIETIEVGEAVYRRGITAGIEPAAWEALRRTRVLLKGPITTPQGGGVKSLNVTIRGTLGLFANVRPCRSYAPFIQTHHPLLDVVIIRENEEDVYAGIEHRQTHEVTQCLKLISRPGCEKIIRYAFEYARRRQRHKVTCLSKDNIMKITDGLFHRVFDEVAAAYPEITTDHLIVDIGMARMAHRPERFDVVVTPNLYGDILSDVVAEISGSVGLAGSANIGDLGAMFEAVHGSAPDIAGRDLANPSGLLFAAVKMLAHIGLSEQATTVHNAWLCTLEDGIHTGDIYRAGHSREKVGTQAFAGAIVSRLGQVPKVLKPAAYEADSRPMFTYTPQPQERKVLVGVDVFCEVNPRGQDVIARLAAQLQALQGPALHLEMITNRAVKVWPDGYPETFCTDHWRGRFMANPGGPPITHTHLVELLARLAAAGLDFIKTEHLYTFDGQPGYSLGHGQ